MIQQDVRGTRGDGAETRPFGLLPILACARGQRKGRVEQGQGQGAKEKAGARRRGEGGGWRGDLPAVCPPTGAAPPTTTPTTTHPPFVFLRRSCRFSICDTSARASSKLITSAGGEGGGKQGARVGQCGEARLGARPRWEVGAGKCRRAAPARHFDDVRGAPASSPGSNTLWVVGEAPRCAALCTTRVVPGLTCVLHGVHLAGHVDHVAVLKAAHHLRLVWGGVGVRSARCTPALRQHQRRRRHQRRKKRRQQRQRLSSFGVRQRRRRRQHLHD